MKTEQEIFDISYLHVMKQGRPSGAVIPDSVGFNCEYRAADGAQCAAGVFITRYHPIMEGKNFRDVVNVYADCIDPDAVAHCALVLDLQRAHDNAALHDGFLDKFSEQAAAIAKARWLTVPRAD